MALGTAPITQQRTNKERENASASSLVIGRKRQQATASDRRVLSESFATCVHLASVSSGLSVAVRICLPFPRPDIVSLRVEEWLGS